MDVEFMQAELFSKHPSKVKKRHVIQLTRRIIFIFLYFLFAFFLLRFIRTMMVDSILREPSRRILLNISGFAPKPRHDALDDMQLDCEALEGTNKTAKRKLKKWTFDKVAIERQLQTSKNICGTVNSLFHFHRYALSEEERAYPLAYGMVVYQEITQFLFMLNSFYQPQNDYCIALSGNARPLFRRIITELPNCLPNIHVLHRPNITWGSFEIINSTYACLEFLVKNGRKHWKYYQYLSGTDFPLRTNLEMVKIFKIWNGTNNVQISPFQPQRLMKIKSMRESPLPLYKASLSATISREGADKIVSSDQSRKLLDFLNGTYIPDEGFWGSITGSPRKLFIPGSNIAFSEWLKFRKKYIKQQENSTIEQLFKQGTARYYLSRLQIWNQANCKGILTHGSCVFGVEDYKNLIKQPHLVAHKSYLTYQPAAFFCHLKRIRSRSRNPTEFQRDHYALLPQVELNNGVSYENLTHPEWML